MFRAIHAAGGEHPVDHRRDPRLQLRMAGNRGY